MVKEIDTLLTNGLKAMRNKLEEFQWDSEEFENDLCVREIRPPHEDESL